VQEGLDAVALDRRGEVLVGPAPGGPVGGVVEAAGGADEHEPLHEVRPGQGEVEAEAPAHRVAHVRRAPAGAPEQVGAGDEIGVDVRGAAVAGRVDGHGLVVGPQRRREGVPRAAGLGEPVDEDDAGSGARRRGGEAVSRHVRRDGAGLGRRRPGPGRPGSTTDRRSRTSARP
jgi:hypothetical protein